MISMNKYLSSDFNLGSIEVFCSDYQNTSMKPKYRLTYLSLDILISFVYLRMCVCVREIKRKIEKLGKDS